MLYSAWLQLLILLSNFFTSHKEVVNVENAGAFFHKPQVGGK
jgi:hypothetical protein